mmetsp:Transcript_6206/g.16307  ORF Transcript_6206/g.16307 Transcript_6206/m.16307 type:complete len:229 (-) Transcript_6206:448-1134(-)
MTWLEMGVMSHADDGPASMPPSTTSICALSDCCTAAFAAVAWYLSRIRVESPSRSEWWVSPCSKPQFEPKRYSSDESSSSSLVSRQSLWRVSTMIVVKSSRTAGAGPSSSCTTCMLCGLNTSSPPILRSLLLRTDASRMPCSSARPSSALGASSVDVYCRRMRCSAAGTAPVAWSLSGSTARARAMPKLGKARSVMSRCSSSRQPTCRVSRAILLKSSPTLHIGPSST